MIIKPFVTNTYNILRFHYGITSAQIVCVDNLSECAAAIPYRVPLTLPRGASQVVAFRFQAFVLVTTFEPKDYHAASEHLSA
jgi:hypothetical protein